MDSALQYLYIPNFPAMASQQFCLRWNNHFQNFISVFTNLLTNEMLVDVTLAAEGKQLQAHKVVLSACSTYFQVNIEVLDHWMMSIWLRVSGGRCHVRVLPENDSFYIGVRPDLCLIYCPNSRRCSRAILVSILSSFWRTSNSPIWRRWSILCITAKSTFPRTSCLQFWR